ncbi:hypothetical protein [Aureispira anguillae]|uniref:Uncharacterized protein n=1 Tax=Aureispira anguillae TaxID=2864201 RepID=A0A915YHU2_9BACT|nr:hypothetical protein [Aureispira anguillae]BDS13453.1 hypothetical protein AsAng_0041910 [Aureispira anguillae]
MAKKKTSNPSKYIIRVVYGFKEKLKVVLLGELIAGSGNVDDGMFIEVALESGSSVGKWKILEVLHTSFINQHENPNFKGLIVKCKNLADFELLKSLRVYDEVINIIEK